MLCGDEWSGVGWWGMGECAGGAALSRASARLKVKAFQGLGLLGPGALRVLMSLSRLMRGRESESAKSSSYLLRISCGEGRGFGLGRGFG